MRNRVTRRFAVAVVAGLVGVTGFAFGSIPQVARAASCTENSGEVYYFNHIRYGSGYLQLDLTWVLTTNNYCSEPVDTMEVINNFSSSVKDLFNASQSLLVVEMTDDESGAHYLAYGMPTMYNPSDPYSGYLEAIVPNWPSCQGGAPCTMTANNSYVTNECANSLIDPWVQQDPEFVIGPVGCPTPKPGEGALSITS